MMRQGCLVSVIVPIYNVEKYLPRCIDSILAQTYSNLEILLIDDGSSDRCGEIADEYAQKDSRIKAFHKENGGLSDARNYGLNRMNGEYITFVDSDDFVDKKYIEILASILEKTNVDVSMVGCQTFRDETNLSVYQEPGYQSVFYSKEETLKKSLRVELRQSAWGKLYKKRIFDVIRFPKGMLYEDLAIWYDVISLSNGVAFADIPLYKYFVRNDSIMRQSFKIQQLDEVEIIEKIMNKLESERPDLHDWINARKVYSYFLVLSRILSAEDKDNYLKQKDMVKKKILDCCSGLLTNKNVKLSWKIRLLSFHMGDACFHMVDKLICHMLRAKQIG